MNEANGTVNLKQKRKTKLRRFERAVIVPFACLTIRAAVSESDQARYHSSPVSEFQPAANFHPERKMTVITPVIPTYTVSCTVCDVPGLQLRIRRR